MKGIVYQADRDMRVETVPDPAIAEPGDVIVKVTKVTAEKSVGTAKRRSLP